MTEQCYEMENLREVNQAIFYDTRDPEFANRLFEAAREFDWMAVIQLLNIQAKSPNDIFQQEEDTGYSILHYACNISGDDHTAKRAAEVVHVIFRILSKFACSRKERIRFLTAEDKYERCPLDIAIQRRNYEAVGVLLYNSAPITLRNQHIINDMYHRILMRKFNEGIRLKRDESATKNEYLWSVLFNFREIIQDEFNPSRHNFFETKKLESIFMLPWVKRRDVLTHPLIQIFIHEKAHQYRIFIWISVIYHILWSVISTMYLIGAINSQNKSTLPKYLADQTMEDMNTLDIIINTSNTFVFPAFFATSFIKEVIEVRMSPNKTYYRNQYENRGQWAVLIVTLFAAVVLRFNEIPFWIQIFISFMYTVGLASSLFLIQGQLSKTETFGVYNQMMVKSFKRLLMFVVTFLPMLLAYLLILNILLPNTPDFTLKWGIGIGKILAMLTGELNYGDVMSGKNVEQIYSLFPLMIVLVLFILSVVILLQNLLVGLTVSDIKELLEEATAAHIATRLECINILERFLLGYKMLQIVYCFRIGDSYVQWLSIKSTTASNTSSFVNLVDKEVNFVQLPKQIQELIRRNKTTFIRNHDLFLQNQGPDQQSNAGNIDEAML